jgi:hypothetical protein
MLAWPLGEASLGISRPSLARNGDACCAAAIAFKVAALLDLLSMLIFASPKVSSELNGVDSAFG